MHRTHHVSISCCYHGDDAGMDGDGDVDNGGGADEEGEGLDDGDDGGVDDIIDNVAIG